jgi:hypothetical protein
VYWEKKALNKHYSDEGVSVKKFCGRFKKGSRQFRSVFYAAENVINLKLRDKCVKNFLHICSLENDTDPGQRNSFLDLWNHHFLQNRQRDFMFKYVHNLLGVNARVAKFNNNVNASCTPCTLERKIPAPQESFSHLFYECSVTDKIRLKCDEIWWPGLNVTEAKRRYFWLALNHTFSLGNCNKFLQIATFTVQFYIWECKLKKQHLSWDACKKFTLELLR